MIFGDNATDAQILRNIVDFSTKSNQFLYTNLSRNLPEIIDSEECRGDSITPMNIKDGIDFVKRNEKLSNAEISYAVILCIRGYKFRKVMERAFLCEEKAIDPAFESFPTMKPSVGSNDNIKAEILKALLETDDKDNEILSKNLIRSVPGFLEKSLGVLYTGRFISISEWIKEKEKEGKWISDEVFSYKSYNMMPWAFSNLLALQIRGYYLQEIPEQYKDNDYVLVHTS